MGRPPPYSTRPMTTCSRARACACRPRPDIAHQAAAAVADVRPARLQPDGMSVAKTIPTRETAAPDAAELADLQRALTRIAPALDEFLKFGDADRVLERRPEWLAALDKPLPEAG